MDANLNITAALDIFSVQNIPFNLQTTMLTSIDKALYCNYIYQKIWKWIFLSSINFMPHTKKKTNEKLHLIDAWF